MALYGWALHDGVGIFGNEQRAAQMLQQSKHLTARAVCLSCGIAMAANQCEAFRLLSTECDTSDPHVQWMLGRCYAFGYGCTRDKAQAVQWFERAGNHIAALNNLSFL
eukprot:TRINITY_DN5449_c0_g1_i1.p2 TRINITY_DN5449_c0_g1~~TRINITY_DN5449_c0_g1_i1.p2  ORF type:complete len:122 (-),score=32.62 TRINITY_DN5449_c0_g1_i1:218-541(-)